ncbi:MAG: neutral zinc metallopeptidase, partial [Chloroflexota bacterium]|nr:neutral zinc metallopeptidase [Chloroflexota bacterium]
MRRTAVPFLVVLLSLALPWFAAAQDQSDARGVAATAVALSRLEATGDFNALYDRIHPDAHAVVPRAAAFGWFEEEFAPRGPGVSTVTGVRFVEWTWAVTGKTYPYTAEVSFEQPFADGTVAEDVVRLVQDRNGEWRWFFGRDRAFVEEQIARYAPPVPPRTGSGGVVAVAEEDIGLFWEIALGAAGRRYVPPGVVPVEAPLATACGALDPYGVPAAYCRIDRTIYYAPLFFADREARFGDFAWVTVLAHEWGHHVQHLLGIEPGPSNAFELQADCLAGSYARDAGTRGLLDP